MKAPAIVLVSGGLDSVTALAWAKQQFGEITPVSFYYGQRHHVERRYAAELLDEMGLNQPINIDLSQAFITIGGSSLTSGTVHDNPSTEEVDRTQSDLPPSFVPGRNIMMVSAAASLGYTMKIYDIVGGWNAVDYSGYPDCRPEFFSAMHEALNIGLGLRDPIHGDYARRVAIHTPLILLSKAEIIQMGLDLGVPYNHTWSCYAGGETPCGECDSCKIRAEGFAKLGVPDPALTGKP